MQLDTDALQALVNEWAENQTLPPQGVTVTVQVNLTGAEVEVEPSGLMSVPFQEFFSERQFTDAGIDAKGTLRISNSFRMHEENIYHGTIGDFLEWCQRQRIIRMPYIGRKSVVQINALLKHHSLITEDLR